MMSEPNSMSQPAEPFEYMLYEGDPDHLKTIVSSPRQKSPRIDPDVLKLTHRIGRGPFGDLWVATHHLFSDDYDEYHEVAVKMLHFMKEDQIPAFLTRFDEVFFKCQGLQGVCLLQGISRKMGKVCIAMKFYEGSVGDKMAHLREGRLPLSDALRYGIDLAQGIMELHSRGVLVLNVKPCNALLDENDRVILGDFGIPHLLLDVSPPSPELVQRLGTPHYMAPEQWEPEARGPVSFETDSWGFGCCIVEMLTGSPPWCGKSAEEVRRLVAVKQEKPEIPRGLPPKVEDVLRGCFEYDLRDRPLIGDILRTFESCRGEVADDGGGDDWGMKKMNQKAASKYSYTDWSLLKDRLLVGDTVRSRKPRDVRRLEKMQVPEGTVVGVESSAGGGGAAQVLVRVRGIHGPLRVSSAALERVSFGFAAGDWVRIRRAVEKHSLVGVLHSVDREGRAAVGVVGSAALWRGSCSELEMAECYCVGQFVRLKGHLSGGGRFGGWPRRRDGSWVTGRISKVLPNACLVVGFPGLLNFAGPVEAMADAAEVEAVSFEACEGVAGKYRHLEDFHWAVRPLVMVLGLFAALKLGLLVGKAGRSSRQAKGGGGPGAAATAMERQQQDGQGAGNPAWLPPPVANILFREGSAAAPAPAAAAR
ncbi:unnamed protein product [Spirodela intermedia]|uniref:Protein kinase domain-containing protein n=1 Tax=Spirodela intermedia TaxID=51605 RepID=A0A7I8KJ93_SPIIN|nr:unnamed protein product [Spirodela intermedia]